MKDFVEYMMEDTTYMKQAQEAYDQADACEDPEEKAKLIDKAKRLEADHHIHVARTYDTKSLLSRHGKNETGHHVHAVNSAKFSDKANEHLNKAIEVHSDRVSERLGTGQKLWGKQ